MMGYAWRAVLTLHGWKQSQCDGCWFRTHNDVGKERRTEFVGGPYIPRYAREVARIRQQMPSGT